MEHETVKVLHGKVHLRLKGRAFALCGVYPNRGFRVIRDPVPASWLCQKCFPPPAAPVVGPVDERATCARAGELGHRWCGICPAHEVPRWQCGHPASTSMGDPVTLLADGIAERTHDAHGERPVPLIDPDAVAASNQRTSDYSWWWELRADAQKRGEAFPDFETWRERYRNGIVVGRE